MWYVLYFKEYSEETLWEIRGFQKTKTPSNVLQTNTT